MLPKDLIILGGGASIREGMEKGLFDLLPKTFCIGLNYAYKFIETTAVCGVDETFYNEEVTNLKKLPLFIGKEHYDLKNRGETSIFFKSSNTYDRELTNGVYTPTLTGLFALSLAIKLMEGGTIYLLGYDYGPARNAEGKILCDNGTHPIPLTHWYQGKMSHRGIGKINWYTATAIDYEETQKRITHAEKEFRPYAKESKVNIINVSLGSNIPFFPKMSYEEFLTKKLIVDHNQEDVRKDLKESLLALKKEKDL